MATADEPHEHCRQCEVLLPMSKLYKHIMECSGTASRKRYRYTIIILLLHGQSYYNNVVLLHAGLHILWVILRG